jgi:uncharacterized caspase-like protein
MARRPTDLLIACLSCGIFLVAGLSHVAAAPKRVALVIGNAAYQHTAPLPSPRNDAEDMAAQLTTLGFQVIHGQDLDKAGMNEKIAKFAEVLSGADVGVFFYAGHGLQVGGKNYLIPVDAKLMTANSIDFEIVPFALVQRVMERETKTNIIFLDACRDNPLAQNLTRAMGTRGTEIPRGLAPVESGIGTLISFSTQPGTVALDGRGRNSPFAAALIKRIGDEEPVADVLVGVRNDVITATHQQQVPWEHSALRARFYFSAPKSAPSRRTSPEAVTRSGLTYEQRAELDLWLAIDKKNPALLEAFVEQFPNGRFANTARLMAELLRKEQAN